MIKHISTIKVRYAETDQMGYVHHSHYALYLEEARMELLNKMGIECARLEHEGIIMPVAEMRTRYSFPLRFGDTITVETEFLLPLKSSLEFHYRIYNQDNKLVSRSRTTLVLADQGSGKLLSNPQEYLGNLRSYIQQSN